MKTGLVDYAALLTKLQEEKDNMADYYTNTRNLHFHTDEDSKSRITLLTKDNNKVEYGITELAESQIASRLKIPMNYFKYMKENSPALLDENVNTWLQEKPEQRFVRTLYGKVRAFLSDRYKQIDNMDIATVALKVINGNSDLIQGSLEVTENHLYIKFISERLTDNVDVDDIVQAGFVISNSETGLGCVKVEPLIYRKVCSNGMILPDRTMKKYHVGQRQEFESQYAIELFRDETIRKADEAFMMKLEDIIRGALNEKLFQEAVNKMRQSKQVTIDVDPVETTKALGTALLLNEAETMQVGANYLADEDFTQYGLANAVTKAANSRKDYERATELERMGALVLGMDIKAMLKNVDSRKKAN